MSELDIAGTAMAKRPKTTKTIPSKRNRVPCDVSAPFGKWLASILIPRSCWHRASVSSQRTQPNLTRLSFSQPQNIQDFSGHSDLNQIAARRGGPQGSVYQHVYRAVDRDLEGTARCDQSARRRQEL